MPQLHEILRPGLLEGSAAIVAAAHGSDLLGDAVAARLELLGARVTRLVVDPAGEEEAAEAAAAAALSAAHDPHLLVWDGAGAFAREEGVRAVRAALDGAWLGVRPVATRALLERGGGRLLLLAPPPGGPEAEAARAGLENMARTLSIEWARHGVRAVAVHPGAGTEPVAVAELAAFLASPAGDYYSGCLFSLGSV